jgi:hypothetical protein
VALALIAGCASAEKRMNQGLALEQRGRSADAAARYVDALEKDPSLTAARARLQETGDRAVLDAVAEAAALDAANRGADAADALVRLDALRRESAAVGVQLATPADFADRRRAIFSHAIDEAITRAAAAGENSEFSDALRRLERAAARWEPTPEERAELDRARFDAQLGWAEVGMESGSFRAAYERAGAAAALFGRGSEEGARALAVQEEALRRGTVRVAILPVAAERGVRLRVPDELVPALNDALEASHWSRAPRFVAVLDPRTVRSAARMHGGPGRQPISLYDALSVGRTTGAELVVRATIDSVVVSESGVRETRRPARTTAGADTAYTFREGRQSVRVRVTYTVVYVNESRESSEQQVWASGDSGFREARFAGDPRDLALGVRERDLFDQRLSRAGERELISEITRELGTRLERDVFDRILREVR